VQRVVVKQYESDVGGASKCELVYDAYLVVPQQNGRHILEAGERELIEQLEWCMLDGQFSELAESAKCESIHPVYAISIQSQLSQVLETGKSVGGQIRHVVFGNRQVFDGLGYVAQWHERQVSGVAEYLKRNGARIDNIIMSSTNYFPMSIRSFCYVLYKNELNLKRCYA